MQEIEGSDDKYDAKLELRVETNLNLTGSFLFLCALYTYLYIGCVMLYEPTTAYARLLLVFCLKNSVEENNSKYILLLFLIPLPNAHKCLLQ